MKWFLVFKVYDPTTGGIKTFVPEAGTELLSDCLQAALIVIPKISMNTTILEVICRAAGAG
jgi:hypothetical protein